MRDLRLYRQKRDPDRTPEPFGGDRATRALPPGELRTFCVQQHAATRMHWDLRLEIGEVLVSWAVPRGPTLDPAERRLAVQTEDHPLEYGAFEGVIPPGNYGAGAMILWDRGVYRTIESADPVAGLESGKLDLVLLGHKLRGRFALVRTARGEGRDWLLLYKGEPPEEGPELVEALPGSVLSGLRVEELRDGASRNRTVSDAARRAKAPKAELDMASLRPMLAKREERPFSRKGWLFEVKVDGVRVLAAKRGDDVEIRARTGADRTAIYPEIARALRHLPLDRFVLDGEIAVLDERGRPSFEHIQRRFTQSDPELAARLGARLPGVLFAFDLLEAAGRDLRGLPLEARRRLLERFVPHAGFVRLVDSVAEDGVSLFELVRDLDLEGIVAKRADSPYETGRRSDRWRKVKVPRTASLLIAGLVAGKGSRRELGSLMLAWHAGDSLMYAGNVGSGLSEADVAQLVPELEARRVSEPAFQGALDAYPDGSFFVRPELVCEVRFTEVTSAGSLRHPVFLGLRDDIVPSGCRAPSLAAPAPETDATPGASAPVPAAAKLEITRRDKVFWPEDGTTKGDLLDYYEAAWPFIAPYLRDRPLVLTRYPDGIEGKSFFQQNAPSFTPDWATRREIDGTDFFICNDLQTLLYVVNSGAIPLHVWGSRTVALDHPDWLILDLDPKQAPFESVVRVARHLHRLLDALETPHFVKTSGQTGLHVLVPMGQTLPHAETRMLAEVIARVVVADLPEIATVTRPVAARGDRVYVDFGQNGRGRLMAAPFSVRPRPHAPVSTPLTWAQVTTKLDPTRFTLRSAPRITARRGDPMQEVLGPPADVERLLGALSERLQDRAES